MNSVEVKKTYAEDFEKIYPLLREFESPYTKKDWYRIFTYQWDQVEDFVGFHLEHNNSVVGFMGLIFSRRCKGSHQYTFCNITSFIVKESYRTATVLLMRKLKELKDTIFIVLRPMNESYRLFTTLGFVSYESRYKIIPVINWLFGKWWSKAKVYNLPTLLDKVDAENRSIVIDHMNLNCKTILIDFNGKRCLLVYTIKKHKHYLLFVEKVHILYVSDLVLFNKNIYAILKVFKTQFSLMCAIYIDSRFIYNNHCFLSIKRETIPPKILWSNPYKNHMDIDELYSEAVLL